MKIVNYRRFILSSLISAMILISFILIILYTFLGFELNELEETQTKKIWIEENDTLWNIAIEYKQEEQSIQEYISSVKKLNNMKTSDLQAGQSIEIYL